jgi:hypothetical protein
MQGVLHLPRKIINKNINACGKEVKSNCNGKGEICGGGLTVIAVI